MQAVLIVLLINPVLKAPGFSASKDKLLPHLVLNYTSRPFNKDASADRCIIGSCGGGGRSWGQNEARCCRASYRAFEGARLHVRVLHRAGCAW